MLDLFWECCPYNNALPRSETEPRATILQLLTCDLSTELDRRNCWVSSDKILSQKDNSAICIVWASHYQPCDYCLRSNALGYAAAKIKQQPA